MNQYLSHLANLALNRVDVVQPRLASHFEQAADSLAPSFIAQDASTVAAALMPDGDAAAAPYETRAVEIPVPPQPQASQASVQAARPEAEPHITQLTATLQPGVTALTPITIAGAASEASAKHVPQEALIDTSLPLLQAAQNHPAPAQGERQSVAHPERTQPNPEAGEFVVKPASVRLPALPPEPTPARAQVNSPLVAALLARTLMRNTLMGNAAMGNASMHSNSISATPMEPTPPSIHVSIGRIEIRASQTSTPALAKPRSTNTMSLDDYLKRNGEKP